MAPSASRRAGEVAFRRSPPAEGSPDGLDALRAYLLTIAGSDFVWEAAHLPLYTLWRDGTAREKLFAVVRCTLGDILLALASLAFGLVLAVHRDWPARRFWAIWALTVAFGLGYTAFSDWLNIVVRESWAYSDLMPVLPLVGFEVGVSLLMQWLAVPALALRSAHRAGAPPRAATPAAAR